MRAALLLALAGCTGGGWDWEARVVVGAEAQRVPAVDAYALWLRTETDAVAYPLRDGMLESSFEAASVPPSFDLYASARTQPGALVVTFDPDDAQVYPGERAFPVSLDVEVVSGTVESVELAPVVDPCAEPRGEDLAVIVSGFVIRTAVQTVCYEFAE